MPSSARLDRLGILGAGMVPLLAGLAAAPAWADPLTVSTARTTAVTTAAASGGSAGDVTVASGGSIIVADGGPAVTVDSSNALTNGGTIQSSAATGATAILVDGAAPLRTTISNTGTIGVTGTGGSGNYGIRVTGAVTGGITSTTAGSIAVAGDSSRGLSIEAPFTGDVAVANVSVTGANATGVSVTVPLTGNLSLNGSSSATGAGATGLLIAAPVSGTVTVTGTQAAGAAATTATNADGTVTTNSDGTTATIPAATGVAGVHIADSLGGGFLVDRYYVDSNGAVVADSAATSSDTLVTGKVDGVAGTTAVLVSPLAGASGTLTLSRVGATGTDDGYGFVNRGSITSEGSVSGTAATGLRIAGTDGAGVLVDQGLINQAKGVISATTIAATATGLSIGAGATVPAIVNQGGIGADSSTDGGSGSAVSYAIDIGPGAHVATIVNSGSIAAGDNGTGGVATAIRDQSGTLASIDNSGTIRATATVARAIDLSAGTGPQSVTNSGTIEGDIAFGSGDATYAAHSGSFAGTMAFGAGHDLLSLDGSSLFDSPVTVAAGGSLAVRLAGASSLDLGTAPPVLASLAVAGQSQLAVPVVASGSGISVTGAASFTDQSSIRLVIVQQVGTAPVTLLRADGGIVTDHLAALIGGTSAPFLYSVTGSAIVDDALQVTLHRKTGVEAGFSPGTAALFDQSMAAFGNGATFQAIANLPDQAGLLAAYRQIEPPGFGTMPIRLAQALASAGTGLIRGRLDGLAAAPPGSSDDGRLSPWIEENVSLLRHGDSVADPGFRSDMFSLSVGADYALSKALAVGAAGSFAWNDVHIDGMRAIDGKPFGVSSFMADTYAGWHSGIFFAQLVGGYARNRYDFRRQIDIGSVSAAQAARWTGYQLSGDLVGGLRFRTGRFTIEPSDALSYVKLHQGGYTTTGGGDLDLAVDGKSDKAASDTARVALGYRLPLGDESALDLGLRAGYVANLTHHVNPLTAAFTAGGSPFEMSTVAYRGNAVQEGGSIAYEMPGFYVGLTGDHRQENQYSDTSLALTLRTAF